VDWNVHPLKFQYKMKVGSFSRTAHGRLARKCPQNDQPSIF